MADLKDLVQIEKTQAENNLVSSKINTVRDDSQHSEHSKG